MAMKLCNTPLFQCMFVIAALLVSPIHRSSEGAASPRATVPLSAISGTDSEFAFRDSDHLRRPHYTLGCSAPVLPSGKPDAPLRVHRSSRDKLIAMAANT